jgi:hypothetical protein
MQFEYTRTEWSRGSIYVPTLPICINGFPVGHVLVDTGASATLLPMELSDVLGVDLDRDNPVWFMAADGKEFAGVPSAKKVEFSLEKGGFRPIVWRGTVFFVKGEETILLGQYQCLSELKITLDGRKRQITVE